MTNIAFLNYTLLEKVKTHKMDCTDVVIVIIHLLRTTLTVTLSLKKPLSNRDIEREREREGA